MPPRQRSSRKRGWPDNLYEDRGYYSWRNPLTGEKFGIGRDRAKAFTEATEANIHIAGLRNKPRLIHKLSGSGERTVAKWNEKYQAMLTESHLTEGTKASYKSFGKRMARMLGPDALLESITSLNVSMMLDAIAKDEGMPRTAQAIRTWMRDSFQEARVQGWYTADNPVMDTKLKVKVVVKRSRLSLEDFMRVYRTTRAAWLKNAMALAIVSGQRREDVREAQFRDFHDGFWWLVQQSEKTSHPHKIKIPLDLRLDALGMSLAEVVSQCRRTGIASRYLVHHTEARGKKKIGGQIHIDTISTRFAEEITALKRDWNGKEPPTFHEIRSLSERLYKKKGLDTQALLGHNDPTTTELYDDVRGDDWVQIEVPG